MMENKREYASPRDRIDPSILAEILRGEEPDCGCYGQEVPRRTVQNRRMSQEHDGNWKSSRMDNRGTARQDNDCCCEAAASREESCPSCAKPCVLKGKSLAMVYAPEQEWEGLYEVEEALSHGTLFHALDLPFYCGCGGNCR